MNIQHIGLTLDLSLYLTEKKEVVNRQLTRIIEDEPEVSELRKLVDSIKYTLLGDGKRIRPVLSIMVYELFKKNLEEIVEPACAIELIHSASLMLDDLPCMDNATIRRGKITNHLMFGEATTILASAALWVAAFKIFSKIESVKINPIIMETANSIGRAGLIRGQFLDIESFKKSKTIKELKACYYLKTGVLFENAVKIGALMGNANQKQMIILEKFGRNFGLAYQIRDDILDRTTPVEQSGKDTNIDDRNKKPTYVSLLGIEGAKKTLRKIASELLVDLKMLNLETNRLLDLVIFISHT